MHGRNVGGNDHVLAAVVEHRIMIDPDLGLDFIEKLKPVSYRFNNGDETERYGFIAQDLEQALPASLRGTIEKSNPEHALALIERQNN
jgi:hypothetical protein